MATNRISKLSISVSEDLPFVPPLNVRYTVIWKPAERLADPNVDSQTISGSVAVTVGMSWAQTYTAILADIQSKMSGDTIETGSIQLP